MSAFAVAGGTSAIRAHENRTDASKNYSEERLEQHLDECGLTLLEVVWWHDRARSAHNMRVFVKERSGPFTQGFPEEWIEELGTNDQIDARVHEFARTIADGDPKS